MSTNKLIKIEKRADGFVYEVTPEGKQCQFLQFLINTSNLTWRKTPEETTYSEVLKNNLVLVSKLCAIGYLLKPIKDTSIAKAVIAVNYTEEQSFRGTGKTLFAQVISMATPTVMINSRARDAFFNNNFLFNEVSHETRLVVLDDVVYNNLEPLYRYISSDWEINIKGGTRYTIPSRISPRILITREKPYSTKTLTSLSRSWHIAFSDYYNTEHNMAKEFGNMFTSGWDREQLLLLNKLFIECMEIYNEIGYQPAFHNLLFHDHIKQPGKK